METVSGLLLVAVILAACCVIALLILTIVVAVVLWRLVHSESLRFQVTTTAGGESTAVAFTPVVAPTPASATKKPVPVRRKSMKCPHCHKFTELGTPLREMATERGSELVHACQRCNAEINLPA